MLDEHKELITYLRNQTSLGRLNNDEVHAMLLQMEADGYVIVRKPSEEVAQEAEPAAIAPAPADA